MIVPASGKKAKEATLLKKDMRGRIGDKWSSRVLWMCAVGSGIGLYMVVVERQLQNKERMAAEGLRSIASDSGSGQEV